MIDKLFEALVAQGSHVVLSSDGPLALQRSAALLTRKLLAEGSVRVENEAPDDTQALLEHFNHIVDGMTVRQAMSAHSAAAPQGIILPVRVRADHAPARITLLARLCKALPGADIRLLLIVEDQAAVRGCVKALGDRVVHGEIDPAEARHAPVPAARDHVTSPNAEAEAPLVAPDSALAPVAADMASAQGEAAAAPTDAPTVQAAPTLMARIGEQARLRPLRFALLVAGIPGALIALVLAVGISLAPKSRSTAPPAAEPKAVAVPAPPAAASAPASAPVAAPAREGSRAAPDAKPAAPSSSPKPAAASPVNAASATPAAPPPTAAAPAKAATPPGPAASSAPAPPTPQGSVPVPASAAAPAPPAAANAAPAMAATAPFACSPPSSPPPQLQPRNPSKDSGMVYLISNTVQTVCVTDASGTTVLHELTPDQGGRSFFGRAPWQLQSPGLREIQVFFQGSRINLPRTVSDRVELIER